MNIFEDLIEELKEENLLEETVTISKTGQNGHQPDKDESVLKPEESRKETNLDEEHLSQNDTKVEALTSDDIRETENTDIETGDDEVGSFASNEAESVDLQRRKNGNEGIGDKSAEKSDGANESESVQEFETEASVDISVAEEIEYEAAGKEQDLSVQKEKPNQSEENNLVEKGTSLEIAGLKGEREGFENSSNEKEKTEQSGASTERTEETEHSRESEEEISRQGSKTTLNDKNLHIRRMSEDVGSLEVVEHVLSTIAREQMRSAFVVYDVVPVKQALHRFQEEFKKLETAEIIKEETTLRKETEKWHASLIERDQSVSTTLLRQYCEDVQLNPKSLVALARFYRNSHFTERARSKFDLVVTRLFTKDKGNHREMLVGRDELLKSLNDLYAEWSSIPVYPTEEENSDLLLAAFKFEDFISEAKGYRSFDELLTSGFFKRIKAFKKKTNENFFAPLLVVSAIECNVEIGNRYLDLIEKERKKTSAKKIEEKYGVQHDQQVSGATSKTLRLTELLDEKPEEAGRKARFTNIPIVKNLIGGNDSFYPTSSKVLGVLILIGAVVFGYFTYNNFLSGNKIEMTENEKKIKLERSVLHEFVRGAKISNNLFSGRVTPAWNHLNNKKKEELVGKIYLMGEAKGYSRVELTDKSGRIVAFTQGSRVILAG